MGKRDYVYNKEMHSRFFAIRAALELSQEKIGKKMGFTGSYYSKLETREVPIKESVALAMCYILDVNYDYLVFGEGEMFRSTDKRLTRLNELYAELNDPNRDFLVEFVNLLISRQGQDEV